MGGLPDAVQQRGAADRRRHLRGDTRPPVATQGQAKALMQAPQALGVTRPRPGNVGQTFAKGPPRTRLVDAAKAANMNQQHDRPAETRQIAKAAPVMAVNSSGGDPALGTRCGRRDPSGTQGQPAEAVIDLVNDMKMREQIERVESDRQSKNRVCFDPHPYGAARTEKTSPQHTGLIRFEWQISQSLPVHTKLRRTPYSMPINTRDSGR